METSKSKRLRTSLVAQRYGVHVRTIERWSKDPELKFPKPMVINKLKYWHKTDLDRWDSKTGE